MSCLGSYEKCRTDCLCYGCKHRRSLKKGCIADCMNCDGIPIEEIPSQDLYDPWNYRIGYKSKQIGCELYEEDMV